MPWQRANPPLRMLMGPDGLNDHDDPPSLDEATWRSVLSAVGLGARLRIACGYARVDLKLVRRILKSDAAFTTEFLEAECRHQIRNLIKLEKDTHLPAAIFALERRWPRDFGRHKKPARPRRDAPPPSADLTDFTEDELERFAQALRARDARS